MPKFRRRGGKKYGRKRAKKTYRKKSVKRMRVKKGGKVGNYAHVQLIRPLSLKPLSVMNKYVFYTKAVVENAISKVDLGTDQVFPGQQQCQYVTFHANTPFIFNDLDHTEPPRCNWQFENDVADRWFNDNGTGHPLSPGGGTAMPTVLPGFFDQVSRAGFQYHNHTCVGYKITVTASPMMNDATRYTYGDSTANPPTSGARVVPNQAGVLFITKHSTAAGSNPSGLGASTTYQNLITKPFTKFRKFKSGGATVGVNIPSAAGTPLQGTAIMAAGSRQSASLSMSYSPKKFHNIKDIRDAQQFTAQTSTVSDVTQPQTSTQMMNPRELDAITVGIVPEFQPYYAGSGNVHTSVEMPQPCGKVMLTFKIEATYLHTEPTQGGNNLPAGPEVMNVGGDGGDAAV